MKQTLTQSMAWLHTWGGLIVGWLLFAIFLTGSLAVFDQEIDHWMQPEIENHSLSQVQAANLALNWLKNNHSDAKAWGISLPTERSPELRATVGERRGGKTLTLDPQTGQPLQVRESIGGGFFFGFHFTLNLPRNIGIWIVGLMAMGMLAALVSGIVIHKKIFKEFFTFRPAKGQRSWLDAHNASAVLLLPFHLMITYTGLVIFWIIYMPAAMDALFDGDRQAYAKAQSIAAMTQAAKGPAQPAPLTDLAPLIAQAEQAMGPIGGLSFRNPGSSDAQISIRPVLGNRIELTKGQSMTFDGVTGTVLQNPTESRPSVLTQRVMSGLHFAQFGGYPMRWLYFVCGLVSSAMIASGLVLFTVKRRRKYAEHGPVGQVLYRLVEALNISVIAGLCLACVGLFWINRLLPVDLADRAGRELTGFFSIWLGTLLHALVRPRMQAWREQLGCAALLCLGLPLLSLLTLGSSWTDNTRLMLEITSVVTGALLAWAAWKTSQPAVVRTARNKAKVSDTGELPC